MAISNTVAIKRYFESGEGFKPVAFKELKDLSIADKAELGVLCAAQLGETIG